MAAMLARLLSSQSGRFVAFVLGWAALSLLFAPEAYLSFYIRGTPIQWRDTLALTVINSAIVLPFVPGIVWLTRRVPLERGNWRAVLAAHLPACVAFSLAHSGIYWLACHTWHDVGGTLFYRFHPNLLSYWAVVGFTHAIDYLRKYREHEYRAARLQLRLLKVQLQPHFLFNTLNTISAMMRQDVAAADTMINRLSELLRIVLANMEKDEITLAEELELLRIYMDIQSLRFGERLEVSIEADTEACGALVPALFLQPLVENSLRHGFSPLGADGRIVVRAERRGEQLFLSVTDNGRGLPSGQPLREGLGLSTCRARLEQLYPERHVFSVRSGKDGGTEVCATIPFTRAADRSAGVEKASSYGYSHSDRGRRAVGAGEDRIAPQH